MADFIPYAELTPEQKAVVDSEDYLTRAEAALNGLGLDKLVDDLFPYVRKSVAYYKFGLDKLFFDSEWDVRECAERSLSGLTVEEWIAQNPDKCALPENHLVGNSEREFIPYAELTPEQKALVDSVDNDIRFVAVDEGLGWDKLVDDPSWEVRQCVAFKDYGLDRLVDDPDPRVRFAVAKRDFGLDKLIDDPDEDVRLVVACKINEPDRFADDPDKFVSVFSPFGRKGPTLEEWIAQNPDSCALPENQSNTKLASPNASLDPEAEDERIFYFDKERGHELERLTGIQFPEYYFSRDLDSIIRAPRCFTDQQAPKTTKSSERATSLDELAARARKKANEHNKELNSSKQVAGKKRVI